MTAKRTDPNTPAPQDLAGRISARVNDPAFRPRRILGGGSDLSELPTLGSEAGRKIGPRCFRFTPNRDARVSRIMGTLGVSNRTVAIEVAIDVLAKRLGVD